MKAIQKGRNDKYPKEIKVWYLGLPVPEWLSDIAKVSSIDGDTGEANLSLTYTNKGGYELYESGGKGVLIRTKGKEDYICLGDSGYLFPLTPTQFNLLYRPENKK